MSRTGSVEPARQGRPPGGGKLAPFLTALLDWVEAEPDITMPELAARLQSGNPITAHPASLSRVLLKAGMPHVMKKSWFVRARFVDRTANWMLPPAALPLLSKNILPVSVS
jgi:hypothetical protein